MQWIKVASAMSGACAAWWPRSALARPRQPAALANQHLSTRNRA